MTRLAAAQAATAALNALGLDQTRPIDPFEAIEALGLELGFGQMDDLLGVILPGPYPGVLINSARPASLQRYTAAHEVGHWYLHQEHLTLDDELSVRGRPNDARELDAQTFAANFLMPLDLVFRTAGRHGLRKGADANPRTVYEMALDMRVSYSATVVHLANCRFISPSNRNALLKVRPAAIKSQLAEGIGLVDSRGDVWRVGGTSGAVALEVSVGDSIVVALEERPSTGYRWTADEPEAVAQVRHLRPAPAPFAESPSFEITDSGPDAEVVDLGVRRDNSAVLTPLADVSARQPSADAHQPRVGGRTTRLIGYGATMPGSEHVRLRHVRPFAPEAPLATIDLTTLVKGDPAVEHRRRLLEAFAREEAG